MCIYYIIYNIYTWVIINAKNAFVLLVWLSRLSRCRLRGTCGTTSVFLKAHRVSQRSGVVQIVTTIKIV